MENATGVSAVSPGWRSSLSSSSALCPATWTYGRRVERQALISPAGAVGGNGTDCVMPLI